MTADDRPGEPTGDPPVTDATTHTVEQVVRKQLSDALGGARGMLEAAVPDDRRSPWSS